MPTGNRQTSPKLWQSSISRLWTRHIQMCVGRSNVITFHKLKINELNFIYVQWLSFPVKESLRIKNNTWRSHRPLSLPTYSASALVWESGNLILFNSFHLHSTVILNCRTKRFWFLCPVKQIDLAMKCTLISIWFFYLTDPSIKLIYLGPDFTNQFHN